ncbi:MAG: helix-turn-helix domain-containing protein [Sulfurimonas sp.]|nr:helix-turn-helix domain-containing protein [Sulfurimonas sp.]MBU3938066.1 helix-turn-helix domain-containing protein [bacterium]MBU4023753.1 helix-turn-helix domain-containing protein [bacterium]MBU4058441.1 helix-turn-helix domain-containing protein [bacterium]MBU4111310.1 helix-turn-helix domain-containing protein [bacterium]
MNIEFESLKLLPKMFELMEKLNTNLQNAHTKRWLSVKELAEYLSYSSDRIYKIKDEHFLEGIHFFKKSGKILFDRVAIDSWVVEKDTLETNNQQRQIVDNVLLSINQI